MTNFFLRNKQLWIPLAAISFWVLLSVCYAALAADSTFRNDFFRHTKKIIIPFLSGDAPITILWANHHSSPILHLHQMLNFYLFDANLAFDAYFGIAVMGILGLLFATIFLRFALAEGLSQNQSAILAAVVGSALVALTVSLPIDWPLVSIQTYFLLFGVLVSLYGASLLQRVSIPGYHALGICLVCLAIIVFHNSFGSIFSIGLASVYFFYAVFERRPGLFLIATAVVGLVFLWPLFQSEIMGVKTSDRRMDEGLSELQSLQHILNLPSYIAGFGKALFAGLYGHSAAKLLSITFGKTTAAVTWFLHGAIYIALLLWMLFRRKQWAFFAILMVTIGGLSLSAILFRGVEYPWGVDAGRYALNFRVAVAALLSAGFLFLMNSGKNSPLVRKLTYTVAGILAFSQLVSSAVYVIEYDRVREDNANREMALYLYGTDPDNKFSLRRLVSGRGGEHIYSSVVQWLKEEKLNVFSDSYPFEKELGHYRYGAEKYDPLLAETGIKPVIDQNCVVLAVPLVDQAWRLSVTAEIADLEHEQLVISYSGRDREYSYVILDGQLVYYGVQPAGSEARFCWEPDKVRLGIDSFSQSAIK